MPIQIPGARLIEEIIAGLPTNSRQAIQLRELGAQIDVLKKENEELKAKVAALQPHAGLDAEAGKILKLFFDHSGGFTAHQIMQRHGAQKSVIDFHFDALRSSGFIKRWGAVDGVPAYRITPEGRSFIVKHGMA